jgi:polyisoprenoid-binding protein YceI
MRPFIAFAAVSLIASACSAPAQSTRQAQGHAPAPAIAMAPAADRVAPVGAAWIVDQSQSKIVFNGKHKSLGPFAGAFKNWSARIIFDPNDLPHAKAAVIVQMAGIKTGQQIIDQALPGAECFDVAKYPTASFTSAGFKALGSGKYEASGTLTIKGKAYPAAFPFTLAINGNQAQATGALTLDRTKINVGMESDPGAQWVDKVVTITIAIQAKRA